MNHIYLLSLSALTPLMGVHKLGYVVSTSRAPIGMDETHYLDSEFCTTPTRLSAEARYVTPAHPPQSSLETLSRPPKEAGRERGYLLSSSPLRLMPLLDKACTPVSS